MKIEVQLQSPLKVVAEWEGHQVVTDQPKEDGGNGEGPAPFDLFLASLATCAGFYVLKFCQTRGISSEGITLTQDSEWNEETHLIETVRIKIHLPSQFPEKYRAAVVASANQCTVKKHLVHPPTIQVEWAPLF